MVNIPRCLQGWSNPQLWWITFFYNRAYRKQYVRSPKLSVEKLYFFFFYNVRRSNNFKFQSLDLIFLTPKVLVLDTKLLLHIDQKSFWKVLKQKSFYTRGTLRGIRNSRMAKIPTFYRNWLKSRIKKRNKISFLKTKIKSQ